MRLTSVQVSRVALVASCYVFAAWACLELPVRDSVLTPVWLPSGIVLALMLLWGRYVVAGVGIGDLVVNLGINHLSLPVSLGLMVGDVADPLLVVTLLGMAAFRLTLERVHDVLALFFAGAIGAALSATIGTLVLWAGGEIEPADLGSAWLLYWSSVALGYVLITPFVLAWRHARSWRRIRPERAIEVIACALLLTFVSAAAFLGANWQLAWILLLFPLFIWATLRFGTRGATGSMLLVAVIAVWGTVRETVFLVGLSGAETVQALQSMLAAVILGNLVMSLVLSERNRAIADATHVSAALRRAQELAHMGSWELHFATGAVSWSDELLRLLWPPAGSATSVTVDQVLSRVDARDEPRVRAVIERAIHDRTEFEVEHRVVDPLGAGALRVVSQTGVVLAGDDGEPDRLVVSVLDITERSSVRMLQDELIAAASHDLRNPLTSIVGFADTLCDRWDGLDDHERRSMIGIVHDEGVRMKTLVDDALMQSRIDAGMLGAEVEAVQVLGAIRHAVEDVQLDDVTIDCNPDLVAWGDGEQLTMMLVHLLVNAERYGRRPIIVEASREETSDRVIVRVIDHGPGVPVKFEARMFQRFARGPNAPDATGTGLGLSIVQGIVERAGGAVVYYRDTAGRTVFELDLPAAPRNAMMR